MKTLFPRLNAHYGPRCKKNPTFNPWWAFELLSQHLEHDALEVYKSWSEWVTIQIILQDVGS
jgi:hypothetical protein